MLEYNFLTILSITFHSERPCHVLTTIAHRRELSRDHLWVNFMESWSKKRWVFHKIVIIYFRGSELHFPWRHINISNQSYLSIKTNPLIGFPGILNVEFSLTLVSCWSNIFHCKLPRARSSRWSPYDGGQQLVFTLWPFSTDQVQCHDEITGRDLVDDFFSAYAHWQSDNELVVTIEGLLKLLAHLLCIFFALFHTLCSITHYFSHNTPKRCENSWKNCWQWSSTKLLFSALIQGKIKEIVLLLNELKTNIFWAVF